MTDTDAEINLLGGVLLESMLALPPENSVGVIAAMVPPVPGDAQAHTPSRWPCVHLLRWRTAATAAAHEALG